MLDLDADAIIELLDLEPLPGEGGMFAPVWRTGHGSAIYFLLRPGDFSALHRLTGPEVWHHYGGGPSRMLLLHPDGSVERPVLGMDLRAGHRPVAVVEAGTWMGAETMGEWSLLGATMAPPYDPDGFELGDPQELASRYPSAVDDIRRLTRGAPPPPRSP
ncbi:MAG: cupin domain-containing protein [Actinomycetota bacterium]